MTYAQYQYVFRHDAYGLIDKKSYEEDLNLEKGNYVILETAQGKLNCEIWKVKKILDNDRNLIIYILYIRDTGTWLDDELA